MDRYEDAEPASPDADAGGARSLMDEVVEEDHERVETTRRAALVLGGEILESSRRSTAAIPVSGWAEC